MGNFSVRKVKKVFRFVQYSQINTLFYFVFNTFIYIFAHKNYQ